MVGLMDKQTGLEILGLEPWATLADARTAFRRLAKTWHPDRYAKDPLKAKIAEEKMKQVNTAFHFLVSLLPDPVAGQTHSDPNHGCDSTHGKHNGSHGFFASLAAGLKKFRHARKKTKVQAAGHFGQTTRTYCRAKNAGGTRKTTFETLFQNAVNHNLAGVQPRFHPKIRPSGCYARYGKCLDPVTGRPRNMGYMKSRSVGPVEKISPISPVSPVKKH